MERSLIERSEEVVRRRAMRTRAAMAAVATFASIAGALAADRIASEPVRSLIGTAVAAVAVTGLLLIRNLSSVRPKDPERRELILLAVWLSAVVTAWALLQEQLTAAGWRFTFLAIGATLPNWLVLARFLREPRRG